MHKWLGGFLRRIADRIDYQNAPRAIGWSFTFEAKRGVVFNDEGRGCQLWYRTQADYERAHTEAKTEHVQVDWKNARARYVGGTVNA